MKGPSSQKGPPPLVSRRLRWVVSVPVGVVLAALLVYAYDYLNINLWMERDAGSLEDYPVRLVENQQEVAGTDRGQFAELNRSLIEQMRENRRNVVTVSRSEIKCNVLRTRAYVKVFLETALPDQPDRRSRLRVICPLKYDGRQWRIAGPLTEKTIE